MPSTRARGVRPCFSTASAEARTSAAAPSLTPDALPAVTVFSGPLTGRPGQRLQGGVGTRMLVVLDQGVALAPANRHRDDFLGEETGRLRPAGALLAAQGEGILVGTRHAIVVGDVVGGLRHRVDAVLLLHQRVDEAPADGGVLDLLAAPEGAIGLAHHVRRARHRLDAAGDGQLHLAAGDGAERRADGVHPRGAEAVEGDAGHALRQTGQQQRHARHVTVVLAGLVGAAEEHLVQRRPVDPGLRSTRAFSGTAARSSARTAERLPPKRPIGVRTASQMNTSRLIRRSPSVHGRPRCAPRGRAARRVRPRSARASRRPARRSGSPNRWPRPPARGSRPDAAK